MCVLVCNWVCGYVNINNGGCDGAWVRAGVLMYLAFIWVSKEKNTWPFDFFFYM